MSTPNFNGGGRRHGEGIGKTLQFYGRLAGALAIGGLFAVLAYETPASARRNTKKIAPAADRQDAVTEDGVLPLLDERRSRVVRAEDAAGLTRTGTRDSSWTTSEDAGDRPSDGRGRRVTRADQDEELLGHTTVVPHSRGPPGE